MNRFLGRNPQQAIGVGIIVFFVLSLATGLVVWLRSTAPIGGPGDLCAVGRLLRHRIVLIDATDNLDATQRETVLEAVEDLARISEPSDKLTVATVDAAHPREPHILFSACAPQSKVEGIADNPAFIRINWLRIFYNPLLEAVSTAMNQPEQKQTPLIESIYGLGRRSDFGPAVADRRLFIVSDMLQNTASLYSLYSDSLDFKVFAARPDAFQNVPDLTGVEVVNLYIDRPNDRCIQGEAQRQFWVDFFHSARTEIRFENWPWPKSTATLHEYCRGARSSQGLRRGRHHRWRWHIFARRTRAPSPFPP